MLINLKDKVTQKFKFLLTLTQMEVLQSTKYVCRFSTKQCWSILLNNWSRWGLVCFEVLKWKKKKTIGKNIELLHSAHAALSKLQHCTLDWRAVMHPLQTGCALMLLAEQLQWKFQGVNNAVSNRLGISGIPNTWDMPSQVTGSFSCLRECCNTVLMWRSRNVLQTVKLPLTFHQHDSKWIMAEFSTLGNLIL